MDELQEIVAFTPDDKCWDGTKVPKNEKQLLQACGNLVIHDRDDNTVRLAHYTVQQYLISNPMENSEVHVQLDLDQAKRRLGELCVAYLSFSDFESQISTNVREENLLYHTWAKSNALSFVGDSKKLTLFSWPLTLFGQHDVALPNINILKYSRVQIPVPTDLQKKYALLQYSIENWTFHTKEFSPRGPDIRIWKKFTQLALDKQRFFEFKPWNDRYSSRSYPFISMFSWALETGHRGLLESLSEPPIGPKLEGYCEFHATGGTTAIYDAVRRGHLAVTGLLASQQSFDVHDLRLLVEAAEGNNLEVFRFLLSNATIILGTSSTARQTLLLLAKSKISLGAAVEIFLKTHGSELSDISSLCDGQGRSALYYAAENGHADVVRLLLARGATCNQEEPVELPFAPKLERSVIRPEEEVSPLAAAIKKGHFEVVQQLLRAGGRVVEQDELGRTPLHWAAQTGNRALALILYEQDRGLLNLNAQDLELRTPLHYAVISAHWPLISLLHSLGADVSAADKYQKTPREYFYVNHVNRNEVSVNRIVTKYLTLGICDYTAPKGEQKLSVLRAAINEGHHDIIRLLAMEGPYMTEPDTCEETVLYHAIEQREQTCLEPLLHAGANINMKCGPHGETALHLALRTNQDAVVQLLMSRKPDLSIADSDGLTPLELAAFLGYENGIRIILKNGAYSSGIGESGLSLLYQAAKQEHMQAMRALLEGGVDSSWKNDRGEAPLDVTVQHKSVEGVRMLLEHGADPGIKDSYNSTPLHYAMHSGFLEGIKILLEHGANLGIKDNAGDTPLHCAAHSSFLEGIRILLEHGADPGIKNHYGHTPLHCAMQSSFLEGIRILLEHGADPEIKDNTGDTPLHRAAYSSFLEGIRILLEHGANPGIKDNAGDTPLHWAAHSGFLEGVELLLEHVEYADGYNIAGQTPSMAALRSGHQIVAMIIHDHIRAGGRIPRM
jgi:ankyrin repeat protein